MVFIRVKDVIHSDVSGWQFLVDGSSKVRLFISGVHRYRAQRPLPWRMLRIFYRAMRIPNTVSSDYSLSGLLATKFFSERNLTRAWKNMVRVNKVPEIT